MEGEQAVAAPATTTSDASTSVEVAPAPGESGAGAGASPPGGAARAAGAAGAPQPVVPNVEVRYENLYYAVKLQQQQQERSELPSVPRTLLSAATFIPRKLAGLASRKEKVVAPDFIILDNVSGVIRPGTLTL